MAVVQLYYHLAPQSEQGVVTKAFIRLLKGHRSVSVCPCVCVCVRACVRVCVRACIDGVKCSLVSLRQKLVHLEELLDPQLLHITSCYLFCAFTTAHHPHTCIAHTLCGLQH